MANEKRLIDAKAGKKVFSAIAQPAEYKGVMHMVVPISEIDKLPTVDAVHVVRCRECKHHYWEQEPCHGNSVHYCKLPHMSGVEVFKEFFCYYGERRENE